MLHLFVDSYEFISTDVWKYVNIQNSANLCNKRQELYATSDHNYPKIQKNLHIYEENCSEFSDISDTGWLQKDILNSVQN